MGPLFLVSSSPKAGAILLLFLEISKRSCIIIVTKTEIFNYFVGTHNPKGASEINSSPVQSSRRDL